MDQGAMCQHPIGRYRAARSTGRAGGMRGGPWLGPPSRARGRTAQFPCGRDMRRATLGRATATRIKLPGFVEYRAFVWCMDPSE